MGVFGIALKRSIGIVSCLFVLLVLLSTAGFGTETKTAYTRDGVNFVSKERMQENIQYEYAKPGDYREVQVPLNTIVVNASIVPTEVSNQTMEKTPNEETKPSNSSQNAPASASEKRGKYPYASIGIGLLMVGGAIVFVASGIYGRGKL
jgi:hypothetical protein